MKLDPELIQAAKIVVARDGKTIGELIRTALGGFLLQQKKPTGRRSGLTRLLAKPPIHVTDEQFREVMELDFYEQ